MESTGRFRLSAAAAIAIVVVSLLFSLRELTVFAARDAQSFIHGDWLINLAAGQIRRGPLGSAILDLSSAADISPILLIAGTQIVLTSGLCIGTLLLLRRQSTPNAYLFLISPGIVFVLWVADPASMGRKELFGLFSILLLCLPGGGWIRLLLSGVVLATGAIGHMVNVLLLPAWFLSATMFFNLREGRLAFPIVAVTSGIVGLAGIYAVTFRNIPDATPICARVLDALPDQAQVCNGAINALAAPENGIGRVREALDQAAYPWLLPFAYALAVAPLVRAWTSLEAPNTTGFRILAALAPIFPLYLVGLDWGRWLAIQVTIAALFMLGLGARRLLREHVAISLPEQIFWILSALLWSPIHMIGVQVPGFFAPF